MDPNITLQEILKLAKLILDDGEDINVDDVYCLAELIDALDEWLSNGGFLPVKWERKQ